MISIPDALARFPGSSTFVFSETHDENVKLLRLVASGFKTVSCEAAAGFEQRGETPPAVGRVDVALHNNGLPVLAIRTVEVSEMRYDEMTEELVMDQGEFKNLYHWQETFKERMTAQGLFADDAVMLLERFEVADRFW